MHQPEATNTNNNQHTGAPTLRTEARREERASPFSVSVLRLSRASCREASAALALAPACSASLCLACREPHYNSQPLHLLHRGPLHMLGGQMR